MKSMARQPLEVGNRVWLEATDYFFRRNEERKIREYVVVDANKSSAYLIDIDRLEKYNEDPKRHAYMKRRVEQRTHNVKGDGLGTHFTLWMSEEDFQKNVIYNKTIKETRQQAHELIDKLPLSILKEFINQFQ